MSYAPYRTVQRLFLPADLWSFVHQQSVYAAVGASRAHELLIGEQELRASICRNPGPRGASGNVPARYSSHHTDSTDSPRSRNFYQHDTRRSSRASDSPSPERHRTDGEQSSTAGNEQSQPQPQQGEHHSSSDYVLDEATGYYRSISTGYLYDPKSGYFYDPVAQSYIYYDAQTGAYLPHTDTSDAASSSSSSKQEQEQEQQTSQPSATPAQDSTTQPKDAVQSFFESLTPLVARYIPPSTSECHPHVRNIESDYNLVVVVVVVVLSAEKPESKSTATVAAATESKATSTLQAPAPALATSAKEKKKKANLIGSQKVRCAAEIVEQLDSNPPIPTPCLRTCRFCSV
jgi:hypothetical protein